MGFVARVSWARVSWWLSVAPAVLMPAMCVQGQAADISTATVLAQSFVAEAGWRSERDWAAMAHVHHRRARQAQVSLTTQVVRYCAIWKRPGPRAWVLALSRSPQAPVGWPSGLRWARHRPLWERALWAARHFVAAPSRVSDPCRGRADHFGGAMDQPGPGWRAIDCGRTLQRYWSTP